MVTGRMHDGEVHTGTELVRRLIAGQFPRWAGLTVTPVPSSGTDNALYRLGTDLVVRLPRIGWAVDQVEQDHEWLPGFASRLPVAIPEPVAVGEPADGYPWRWAVHRWLDGENPVVGRVVAPDLLAADLGGFIRALRRVDPAGGPAANRGEPLANRDAQVRSDLAALRDLGLVDVDAAGAAWDVAMRVPAWSGPPVWIHGDLSPGNLLVSGGRLTGVIDFGCLGVGDPACDLIVAWNVLPAEARAGFRASVGIDDATWARGRGWALAIALAQLPYYRHTNPALAANARHVIGEVLDDHHSTTPGRYEPH